MTFDVHILDGFNSFLLAADIPAAGSKTVAATPGSGNLFDVFVMVILIVGMIRGKIRGMSEELLDVFKWLLVVVAAAWGYQPMGNWLANFLHIPFLIAYVSCYLFIVVVITSIFATIKRKMGEKVFESDLFGKAEYPLGMLAGMVRYGCILMMFLAVLNAFVFDYAQVEIKKKAQEKDLGEGMSFPTKEGLHQGIFIYSLTGQFVRKNLEHQLIEPRVYAPNSGTPSETPGQKREREVDNAVNGPTKK